MTKNLLVVLVAIMMIAVVVPSVSAQHSRDPYWNQRVSEREGHRAIARFQHEGREMMREWDHAYYRQNRFGDRCYDDGHFGYRGRRGHHYSSVERAIVPLAAGAIGYVLGRESRQPEVVVVNRPENNRWQVPPEPEQVETQHIQAVMEPAPEPEPTPAHTPVEVKAITTVIVERRPIEKSEEHVVYEPTDQDCINAILGLWLVGILSCVVLISVMGLFVVLCCWPRR